ncbi:WD40/YVTN/BNR-like repeat-containing protein [Halocalculus aciditolerans]|uniref:Twin-arginine translocation signal domain-containing protein n=1 Tax=Halocalculus aciditolerans TaxID=1383812 RepID=A0A830FC31_9EURY|nr:hypothetical protein [Halocalculus aciditolerans]GGL59684.1 hypothetical protein GCM10009039_17400 [Halocalculus aciditolerans]
MADMPASRRTFLKAAGGAAAATAGGAVLATGGLAASSSGWTTVESPTSKTLYGVSDTVNGPVAVGKTGNILHRKPEAGTWELAYSHGPQTRNNSLRALAVTDDGKRVWFAGGSGALGAYDVNSGVKYNYSAPNEMTSTWEGITVTGNRESETVYVTNGSGEVVKGTTDDEGCVTFGSPQKPGSGSNAAAIDFQESKTSTGHVIDTSGNVFETTDGGENWKDVGIPNAQVIFYDVVSYVNSDDEQRVFVAGGDGHVYRLDCTCNVWTPLKLGGKSFRGIDQVNAGTKIAVGANGSIYEAPAGGSWSEEENVPVSSTLYEVALGDHFSGGPDVIVGNGGTILER